MFKKTVGLKKKKKRVFHCRMSKVIQEFADIVYFMYKFYCSFKMQILHIKLF